MSYCSLKLCKVVGPVSVLIQVRQKKLVSGIVDYMDLRWGWSALRYRGIRHLLFHSVLLQSHYALVFPLCRIWAHPALIKWFKNDVQDPFFFSSLCGAYFNLVCLVSRILVLLWSQ